MDIDEKKIVKFIYKNWQGIVATRTVVPDRIEFSKSEWHPGEEQWILVGYCLDRKAYREFAIKDILDWTVVRLFDTGDHEVFLMSDDDAEVV